MNVYAEGMLMDEVVGGEEGGRIGRVSRRG